MAFRKQDDGNDEESHAGLWWKIGLAIFAGLAVIALLTDKDKQSAASVSQTKPLSAERAAQNLSYCITPKAQYGNYSSFDGGKSAMQLLKDCPSQLVAYQDTCKANLKDSDACNMAALLSAQALLKKFGK